jgi:hypothetical protein
VNLASDSANPLRKSAATLFARPQRSQPTKGLIVVKINGEGRGVTCRAMKPTQKT